MANFKILYPAVLLILMLNNVTKAQHPSQQKPELSQLMSKLDSVIRKEPFPGLMVSIVKKDSLVFSAGLGYADLEQEVPVDSTTQFHLASVTKFFLAMGVQNLIAEGKLQLNDPIKKIAPEIPFRNKWESTHPVKLVHLLEHTAGFEDIAINKTVNMSGKPLTGIDAILDQENALTSRWKPGERMSYSNPGYNVLGYIVEKVSGMPWNEYVQQILFKPLAMNDSFFDLTGESKSSFARGYDYRNGRFMLLPFYMPSSNGASSAMVSNASDMAKFMNYMLHVGEKPDDQLLGADDWTEIEKVHSTLASQHGLQTGYAFGNDLFPNNKKVTLRGHNGKGEGFGSWIFFNREAGLAYAISTNCNTMLWPVSQVIEEFLTKDRQAPTMSSSKIDQSKIASVLGYYQLLNPKNERWEFHRRIFGGIKLLSIDEDKLVVDKGSGQMDSLIHVGSGLFRVKGDLIPSCVVGYDNDGQPFFQGYGNSFYLKKAYAPILFQKICIYLGLLAALLSIVYTVIGVPLALFKKIRLVDLCLVLLPALGVICFLASFRLLGQTDAVHKELFTSANTTSLAIFGGMLFFGLSVLIAAWLLYRRWPHLTKKWVRFPLAFNVLFLFYLVVLFSVHGWIGVPIWTM